MGTPCHDLKTHHVIEVLSECKHCQDGAVSLGRAYSRNRCPRPDIRELLLGRFQGDRELGYKVLRKAFESVS